MSHVPVARDGPVKGMAAYLIAVMPGNVVAAGEGLFPIRKYTYTHHRDAQAQPSAATARTPWIRFPGSPD